MYRISRYWNRLAYAILHLGRWMIWDQTGKNAFLLGREDVMSSTSEAILCNRKIKKRRRV